MLIIFLIQEVNKRHKLRRLEEELMILNIEFRNGEEEKLALEFLEENVLDEERIEKEEIDSMLCIDIESVLVVHFADAGAQGEPGCFEIICCTENGVKVLHGNYVYGKIKIDEIFEKLPMLRSLDSRTGDLPYPFGGRVNIPRGWKYMYMGAMNHLFCRDLIADKTAVFANVIASRERWALFNAIAWFCGA